jgi:hypothetical protein
LEKTGFLGLRKTKGRDRTLQVGRFGYRQHAPFHSIMTKPQSKRIGYGLIGGSFSFSQNGETPPGTP